MISDEGHGGQVAPVRRAVTHARERGGARVREHQAEGVESNAERVQRERVPAACLAGSSKRVWRTKAAKQQSSSLRRCSPDIP